MTKIRKRLLRLTAAIVLLPLLALLFYPAPAGVTFDLRDGTKLEILRVSYGRKHVAHFGTPPKNSSSKSPARASPTNGSAHPS